MNVHKLLSYWYSPHHLFQRIVKKLIASAIKYSYIGNFVIYDMHEKIDARKHSPETQYKIRKQVVRLRKQGFLNKDVAEGVSVGRASKIWQSYKKEGSKAIKLGRRGRRTGEKRTLTTEQEGQVKRALIDKTPNQLKLPFALWTWDAVKLLIEQRLGIEMPIRTVWEYLKRWRFTPQKPVKRAYEQSSQTVQK
ncbi:MAG: winged helix-turn-helix domain-containing protein [Pseudomonadota bacterium]